jgi:hypothetical protein
MMDLGPLPAQPLTEGQVYAGACRVAAFQIQLALDQTRGVRLRPRSAVFVKDALMDLADLVDLDD